jgi:uncharacterized delta-60 repeat protein
MRHRALAFTLCVLIALATASAAQARPGDRDETFSRDGLARASSTAAHQAVAVQGDGSVVSAGSDEGGAIVVTRYRPDGSVDGGFGDGGIATHPAGPQFRDPQLAIDSQGRLVVAGTVGTGGTDGDFVATRFLPDGSPDASFGDGGSVRVGFPNFELLGGLALTGGDGMVLAGSGSGGTDSGAVLVVKLDEAGDPDPSFAGDGKQLIGTAHPDDAFAGAVRGTQIGDGGSIYIAWGAYSIGQIDSRIHVIKLDSGGEAVPSYGNGGVAIAPGETGSAASQVSSLDLDSEGRAVVAGTACTFLHVYCVGRVRRFTTAGELDTSFADGGVLSQDGPLARAIALPDGRLLLTGYDRNGKPTRDDFALRRLLADGAPDRSFSGDGLVTTDFDFEDDAAVDAAVAPDGRVVLMGSASRGAGLARYEVADGRPDADADGRSDGADRCPQRFSQHRSGCPSVDRRVTIDRAGSVLKGRVVSEVKPCASGERVRLLRRSRGRDELIGRDRSKGPNGRWQHRAPDRAGRIYALVKGTVEPEVGRCRRDRSGAVRLGGRGRAR